MNKKIFGVLGLGILLALTACGGGGKTYSDEVLADADHPKGWVIAGPGAIEVGADGAEAKTIGEWNSKSAEEYARTTMTATSIKAVSQKSTDVADKLVAAEVTQLYMLEHVHLGMKDSGGNIDALVNGVKTQFNGSRQLKVYSVNYDAEDDVYSPDSWMPSAEVYAESMTPDIYWTTANHSETKDEHGFDWNANPVLIGDAGIYTVVACKYKNPSSNGATHGLALILEVKKDGVGPHQAEFEGYSVIGSFEGSGWATDVDMVEEEAGVWAVEVDLKANDELKVRKDHDWNTSYGFDNAIGQPEDAITGTSGGNIIVVADGHYGIAFSVEYELVVVVKL